MDPLTVQPDAICDGGDLDCGSGLLLIIRKAMQPLLSKGVLEVRSTERSVGEDLPAWCRLVGHRLLSTRQNTERSTSYFIQKKSDVDESLGQDLTRAQELSWRVRVNRSEGMGAQVYARNHLISVGQPASFDTSDKAPSAVEYLLGALGACLTVGMQWRASQKNIVIRNLEISVQAKPGNILTYLSLSDDGNPGFEEITVRVYLDSDTEISELEALFEETIRRSPVAQTLIQSVKLSTSVRSLI